MGGGGGGGVHSIGGGGVVKGVVAVSMVGESETMTVTPGPRHALSLWRRVCGTTMWRYMGLGHDSRSSVHTGSVRSHQCTQENAHVI